MLAGFAVAYAFLMPIALFESNRAQFHYLHIK